VSEQQAWLEPIRNAASAVVSNPPPLAEWERGEDEGEIISHDVENLLVELGWPTRTRTYTVPVTVCLRTRRTELKESTVRYFPCAWLDSLHDHVSEYVKTRDAAQEPDVPDRLRLRELPQSADLDAVRKIVDDAWDDAWDELACSVSIMVPDLAMGMDFERYQFAVCLWHGQKDGFGWEPEPDPTLPYEERLRRDEKDLFPSLRDLPSPKWRAWFLDTWRDRVAIHDILARCGGEATENLEAGLLDARYALDTDVTHTTIAELVNRLEARHRFLAAAFAYGAALKGELLGKSHPRLAPARKRPPTRPPSSMMERVAQLKEGNVQWKDIKEQVEREYEYRFDSVEALRKYFERWHQRRRASQ